MEQTFFTTQSIIFSSSKYIVACQGSGVSSETHLPVSADECLYKKL